VLHNDSNYYCDVLKCPCDGPSRYVGPYVLGCSICVRQAFLSPLLFSSLTTLFSFSRGDAPAAIDGEEWTLCSTTWPANTNDYIWFDMLATQTFDNLNMSIMACSTENITFVASYSSDNVTWVPFWTQGLQNLSVATYTAPQKLQARYLLFKVISGVVWCS
jgi:hypothetical protein